MKVSKSRLDSGVYKLLPEVVTGCDCPIWVMRLKDYEGRDFPSKPHLCFEFAGNYYGAYLETESKYNPMTVTHFIDRNRQELIEYYTDKISFESLVDCVRHNVAPKYIGGNYMSQEYIEQILRSTEGVECEGWVNSDETGFSRTFRF